MKFQDWLDANIITVTDNVDSFLDSNLEYINTTLEGVKKIYNFLKNTIYFDYIKIAYIENNNSIFHYYVLVNDELICMEELIDAIRLINREYIISKLDEQYIDDLLVAFDKNVDLDKEFYCLLTINPNYYNSDYIEKIEKYLNKNLIGELVNAKKVCYDMMYNIKYDNRYRAILSSVYYHFKIACFSSIENIEKYKEQRRKMEDSPIIKAVSMDELHKLLGEDNEITTMLEDITNDNKILN